MISLPLVTPVHATPRHNPEQTHIYKFLEREPTREIETTLLKLETTTTASSALLEKDWLTTSTEWRALERIALVGVVIGVVSPIESPFEIWIGQDLVCYAEPISRYSEAVRECC